MNMENTTAMTWSKMATAIFPEHRHEAIVHFASLSHSLGENGVDQDNLLNQFVLWGNYNKSEKMLSDLNFLCAKGWVTQKEESLHLSLPELSAITAKTMTDPGSRNRKTIPLKTRMRVYARDGWSCWLCDALTSEKASFLQGHGDDWVAVLDHVLPHSEGGSDDENNLMTAHRWCNSVRRHEQPMNVIVQGVRVITRIWHKGFSVEKLRISHEKVKAS